MRGVQNTTQPKVERPMEPKTYKYQARSSGQYAVCRLMDSEGGDDRVLILTKS